MVGTRFSCMASPRFWSVKGRDEGSTGLGRSDNATILKLEGPAGNEATTRRLAGTLVDGFQPMSLFWVKKPSRVWRAIYGIGLLFHARLSCIGTIMVIDY